MSNLPDLQTLSVLAAFLGSDGAIVYSVFTVFMLIVFIIYYCVAYHYYFTDTFEDSYDYEPSPKRNRPRRSDSPLTGSRRRIIQDVQSTSEDLT